MGSILVPLLGTVSFALVLCHSAYILQCCWQVFFINVLKYFDLRSACTTDRRQSLNRTIQTFMTNNFWNCSCAMECVPSTNNVVACCNVLNLVFTVEKKTDMCIATLVANPFVHAIARQEIRNFFKSSVEFHVSLV